MIEGMIGRIAKEMGTKPFVIATGGLAELFAGGTDVFDETDADLTLRGLVHIHQINRAANAA
jgi:type III pantothenate kinase